MTSERDTQQTFAARVLARLPDVRAQVEAAPEFRAWLAQQKWVLIDGKRFYVVGGDMLRDDDEMIFTWARRNRLVSEETIRQLQQNEEPEVGE